MSRAARILIGICLAASACSHPVRGFLGADDGGAPAAPPVAALPPNATAVPAGPTATDHGASPPPAGATLVRAEPVSFGPIAHAADPGVVTISTVAEEVDISHFTHRRRAHEVRGLGTGFVVDKGGIIVTNNHVVDSAVALQVKLSDEREFPGKVVGTDPMTDIAVVRIDANDLPALPLGDSDAMEVGDWVVAIGNPFGLSHTVSAGIISAKGRTREELNADLSGYYDFIQTDASINPGNSGGPLLNLKGQVVGMNSAIRGGGAQGIGFAIPVNMIKQLLPMLLRDGKVTRSALGINIVDVRELSDEDRQLLKLARGEKVSGAVIDYLIPGGPAARAGLEPGDIILAFDGQPIERSTQLQWLASTAGVGRTATLRVRRAGKLFDLPVALGRLPDDQQRMPR